MLKRWLGTFTCGREIDRKGGRILYGAESKHEKEMGAGRGDTVTASEARSGKGR